jgi:hypothetical protein
MRTPAVLEWLIKHNADGCEGELTSCVACLVFRTYWQVLDGFARGELPVLAAERVRVGRQFVSNEQQDVFEFFEQWLEAARSWELDAGRWGVWGGVELSRPQATHVDRLFGFVEETRRRCTHCQGPVQAWYSSQRVLRVSPADDSTPPRPTHPTAPRQAPTTSPLPATVQRTRTHLAVHCLQTDALPAHAQQQALGARHVRNHPKPASMS